MTSDEIPPGRASVAIATCAAARGADEDAPLLTEALEDLGVSVVEQDWHDDTVEWSSYDLVVIRSTWDYMRRRDEFVAWARRVESLTRLANPASVVDWNTDKHYLAEMAAVGVPIVPTTFVEPSGSTTVTGPDQADPADLADLILGSPRPGRVRGQADDLGRIQGHRPLSVSHR